MSEPGKQAAPPADLDALSGNLAALARQLAAHLDEETALVRAMRVAAVAERQAEKTRLIGLYEQAFKAFAAAAKGIKNLPEAIRERLVAANRILTAAVGENETMLRAGRIATERLIGSIIDAVKQSQPSTAAYSQKRGAPRHRPLSAVAVDRRL
jgi:hypothetical protein